MVNARVRAGNSTCRRSSRGGINRNFAAKLPAGQEGRRPGKEEKDDEEWNLKNKLAITNRLGL
jgi:hypothetical protein